MIRLGKKKVETIDSPELILCYVAFVWWQQDKNGKEVWKDIEGNSSRMNRGR